MPPVYGWLAAQPDSRPVLELPALPVAAWRRPMDLRRQMYVLYHQKPRLDGASGFTSNRYEAFRRGHAGVSGARRRSGAPTTWEPAD